MQYMKQHSALAAEAVGVGKWKISHFSVGECSDKGLGEVVDLRETRENGTVKNAYSVLFASHFPPFSPFF